MSSNPTCAERIQEQMAGRFEDIKNAESKPTALDELQENVLSIEVKRSIKIELSAGGPADWFEINLDNDGSPSRGSYHFQDWYDHAERALTDKELDEVVDVYLGGDTSSFLNV